MPKRNEHGFAQLLILVLVLLIIGVSGWAIWQNQKQNSRSQKALATILPLYKFHGTKVNIGEYHLVVPEDLTGLTWLKNNPALGPICLVGESTTFLPDSTKCISPGTGSVHAYLGNGKIDVITLRYPQGFISIHAWETLNGLKVFHYGTVNLINVGNRDYSFSEDAYRFPLSTNADQWVEVYEDSENIATHSEASKLRDVYAHILHSVSKNQ